MGERERHRRYYEKCRRLGLCRACGGKSRPNRVLCAECAAKNSARGKVRREQLTKKGLCQACLSPTEGGKSKCAKCLDKGVKWGTLRLRDLKARAIETRGGACQVCGWRCRPELLEWHHWKFTGSADRARRTVTQALKEVIKGTDRELMCVCPICHRALHYDRIQFNPRTGKIRKRR